MTMLTDRSTVTAESPASKVRLREVGADRTKLRDVVVQSAPLSEIVWRSVDGTSCIWRVDRGDWRICTRDERRARRLARLTGIELVGDCVVGPFERYLALTGRKLRGKAVRRVLNGIGLRAPNGKPAIIAELGR